ncbi:mycobactin peptide synthetase (plasmid) [Azospirillum sp. B510]|uniref:non-ribosomal peptide synthetase n=1 Tax=Azospirillum sp. (strain B510) TaxID=137722 RepID=UPI0001C4CF60|nr:non-ribosomal peptide synthetase [Azospirillum sp. B510]BAI76834.1 mycobactin peptide synthetase [Azospirillum sp. B510]
MDSGCANGADIIDAYPLTRLQAGMLFHSLYDEDAVSIYLNVFSFTVKARLDETALTKAVQAAVQRHAVLRTGFDLGGFSEPVQIVYASCPVAVAVGDWRSVPPENRKQRVSDWIAGQRRRGFDIKAPPLFTVHAHLWDDETFQFSLRFHHAILDGWSVGVLLVEVLNEYACRLNGIVPPPLPGAGAIFRRSVELEQAAVRSAAQREFWNDYLRDNPASSVSRGHRRQGEWAGGATERTVDVPAAIGTSLGRLAAKLGVPLKSLFFAAHLRVLTVLCENREVVTGLLTNGRPEQPGAEAALGLFLNVVPFRLRLRPESWRDLIIQTVEAETRLSPFRRYPLAEIVKEQSGRAPFDTVFSFTDFTAAAERLDGGLALTDAVFAEMTNFALLVRVEAVVDGGGYRLVIQGDESALDIPLASIADAFLTVLAAMADDSGADHDTLPLAGGGELAAALGGWNATHHVWPDPAVMPDLFERQAALTPDAVAVAGPATITYGALNRRANQLARHLRAHGVGAETPVAVYIERSVDLLAALLAVLKAGGTFIPLDPAGPVPRNRAILAACGVPVLIMADDGPPPPLPGARPVIVRLDEERQAITAHPDDDLPHRSSPDQLAYIIHTSGSTGTPKGVMVTRRALGNLLLTMGKRIGIGPSDLWGAVTTPLFDIAYAELFLPLTVGAAVKILPLDRVVDGNLWRSEMDGTTIVQATPSGWRLLLDAGWTNGSGLTAVSGGEALPPDLVRQLLATGVRLLNCFGPTETTIWSSSQWIDAASGDEVSIGVPFANTTAWVLDCWGQPAPFGAAGELFFGGDGLARGYAGQAGLTAERFLPDPFGPPGSRLYRTGDRVRQRPDGSLMFLGRLDRQVKVNGFRVELGEIEAVLQRQPAVREAVAAAHSGDRGRPELAVFVVLDAAATAGVTAEQAVGALGAVLERSLPRFMVPTRFAVLPEIPRLANGKIDYRALPVPGTRRTAPTHTPPRTPAESWLAGAFADLLKVEQVGVHDDFFAAGGDSQLCLQLVSKVEIEFGVQLPMRAVFEAPTVEQLAAVVLEEAERRRRIATSEKDRMDEAIQKLSDADIACLLNDPVIQREMQMLIT